MLVSIAVEHRGDESWKIYDDSQVAVIEITIAPERLTWIYQKQNLESDSLHPVRVHFRNAWIDEEIDSVGFCLRGNTSRQSAKKSLKISFNGLVKGKKLCDVEKLNLNGEHNDPSIMRSKLCWDLLQQMGAIASRASHAAVYINGQYYGLYISVEQVDEEFIENQFTDPSGNLWKCLWPADLSDRGDNPRDPRIYYPDPLTLRPYELKTNEYLYDYSQLARLIDIINNTSLPQMADSIDQILDIHSIMLYFSFCILSGNWDSYWPLMNNYYLYYQPRNGRFTIISYDCDNTFGADWFGYDWSQIIPYNPPKVNLGARPLAERILVIPEYRNLYTHFLDFYSQELLNPKVWEVDLDSIQHRIKPWAELDTFRTLDYGFTMDDFNNSYNADTYSNQHIKAGLKEFCRNRQTSLINQLNRVSARPMLYSLNWNPPIPKSDQVLQLEVAAYGINRVQEIKLIRWGRDSNVEDTLQLISDPILSSKRIIDRDRWSIQFPPQSLPDKFDYYLIVEDKQGQITRYPRSGHLELAVYQPAHGLLCLNELLAKNDGLFPDENNNYDDWVEIYNSGSDTIDLNGYYLTDNPGNQAKWKFGSGCIMAPASYQVVWCDEESAQGIWHAGFKLSADGEYLALSDPVGNLIDSVTFPAQTTNISWGRSPDGTNFWKALSPTPGRSNTSTSITRTDSETILQWKIYPNPATTRIYFCYQPALNGFTQLTVYDILGREVYRADMNTHSGASRQNEWDLRSGDGTLLPCGIYFCRLRGTQINLCRKILILR